MKSRLTKDESKALALTCELWELLQRLDVLHPSDIQDDCKDIHSIQNRILARSEKRISYGS